MPSTRTHSTADDNDGWSGHSLGPRSRKQRRRPSLHRPGRPGISVAVLPCVTLVPMDMVWPALILLLGLAVGWLLRRQLGEKFARRADADRRWGDLDRASDVSEELGALQRAYPGVRYRIGGDGTVLEHSAHPSSGEASGGESLAGRPMKELLAEKYRWLFEEALADALESGEIRTLEYELESAEEEGIYEARLVPVRGGSCLLLARDISAQRRLEEEHTQTENRLRQLFKMEALGQLAGGVAHDINNILTVITGHSQLVRDAIGAQDAAASDLDQIDLAAQGAAGLTRQLLAFSRNQKLNPEWLDINQIITRMRRIIDRLLRDDIELRLKLSEDLYRVRADEGSLEQVLVNLALNAADAMSSGGTFSIETKNTFLEEKDLVETPELHQGRYVCIIVSDTGHGMPPEVHQRAFEPFFTTKSLGRGTGLGLASVYGIIQKSEGLIRLESESGVGTTFRIYIPATNAPVTEHTLNPKSANLQGRETILVCDDDAGVRTLMHDSLVASGYNVLVAENPDAAIEIEGEFDDPLHLLVTDVVMAGMSGSELSEILRERRPGLRVLFVSGYPHEVVQHHGTITEDDGYLAKPFSPRELLGRVRNVLDTGSARIWT